MEATASRGSADATRERILRAGIDLLRHKRYDSIRVDDLARAAEVSRATYYRYYKNKHECYGEAAELLCADLRSWSAGLPSFESGEAGYGEMTRWVAEYSEICETFGPILRVWSLPGEDASMTRLGRAVTSELGEAMNARLAASDTDLPADGHVGELVSALIEQLAEERAGRPRTETVGRLLYMTVFCAAPPIPAGRS